MQKYSFFSKPPSSSGFLRFFAETLLLAVHLQCIPIQFRHGGRYRAIILFCN